MPLRSVFQPLGAAGKLVGKALIRRKYLDNESLTKTNLDRCLSTFDLTFLGVGSTLGLGIYVLAGQVASIKAGPAVAISFLVAAVASVFAGLCYAEFGARVPRAGSAYVYSYVTVGELMAFIIGWNLILEYVIGTASVARGYSGYLDFLCGNKMSDFLKSVMPLDVTGLSPYPDFLSLGITLLLTVMLCIGVKESTRFNNIFTSMNLMVVLYAVITGSFKADAANWKLSASEIPEGFGSGGFLPYGFSGMMAGAAMCFYGYVGFDCIATTGEEVKNPQRSIPIGIVGSLLIVFLAYFGVSTVQTLMWPYYDQKQQAPLPYVFKMVGWPVAQWIISIGALAGLSTSLLGGMFPLPRVLYAMANDGLIFRFLAKVHPRFKTPLIATLISGIFAGCMAMMFDVDELAAMMSIGTLLAYTLVATSVLILRYRIQDQRIHLKHFIAPSCSSSVIHASASPVLSGCAAPPYESSSIDSSSIINGDLPEPDFFYRQRSVSTSTMMTSTHQYTSDEILRQFFNLDNARVQSQLTSNVSMVLIAIISVLVMVLDIILIVLEDDLFNMDVMALVTICVILFLIAVAGFSLSLQPIDQQKISFKVPWVPLVPVLSMFVNIYLMLKLSMTTWIRFFVWMFIGFLIYFSYGMWNSNERLRAMGRLSVVEEGNAESEAESINTDPAPLLTERSPLLK